MSVEPQIEVALRILQMIALFMTAVGGVTAWIIQGMSTKGDDWMSASSKQNLELKRKVVGVTGVGVILLLAASAIMWLNVIMWEVEFTTQAKIAWFLLVMAFAMFFLISFFTFTDKWEWLDRDWF